MNRRNERWLFTSFNFSVVYILSTFVTLYITIHVTFISYTLTVIVYHLNSNFRAVTDFSCIK